MKKVLILMALACITATSSQAQNSQGADAEWRSMVFFGANVGANYSNVYDSQGEDFDTDPKAGLALGVFVSIPIGELLGLQPEILFSQKGYKGRGSLFGSSYELTHTSNYLDIPLLLAIRPLSSVTFLAGPQFSFLLSQKNEFKNGTTTIEQEKEFDNESYRKNTLCVTGGLDINVHPIVIGTRVGWDLFKNNGDGSTTTPRYKNVWYQVTLGYRF